jgi:hypothetical protein
MVLAFDASSDRFQVWINGSLCGESSVQEFAAGDWLDLVVTVDSDGYAKLYVNGVQDGQADISALSVPSLSSWCVGSSYSGSTFQCNCAIAEYSVFDRALIAAEVMALYRTDMTVGR